MKAKFKIKGKEPKLTTEITIGCQTFEFGRVYETKEEAEWYLIMFQNALDNLTKQK